MAELALERVSISYDGETTVVDDISLSIADGSFYALVGPSGSGKTSILRVLGGFLQPVAGRVLLGGQDVTDLQPERRDLGIVFQNYALFPHMSVAENVRFGLRMRGQRRRDSAAKVAEMLELVDLPGLEDRFPDELSGGQQQRVALARALITSPKALLLDEPLSALDRKIRQEMQLELKRVQRETGVTAIIVTHDQEEALSLADELMVLDAGVIQQEGRPWEVYNRPRNQFVASFLGQTNAFAGTVVATEPARVQVAGGEAVATGVELGEGITTGSAVTLCVRPERWHILGDGAPEDAGDTAGLEVAGTVADLVLSGQTASCVIDGPVGRVSLTVLSSEAQGVTPGTRLRARATPEDIYVYAGTDAGAVPDAEREPVSGPTAHPA